MALNTDWKEFLNLFISGGVEFMIVGNGRVRCMGSLA